MRNRPPATPNWPASHGRVVLRAALLASAIAIAVGCSTGSGAAEARLAEPDAAAATGSGATSTATIVDGATPSDVTTQTEPTPQQANPEPTPTPDGPRPVIIATLLGESGVMETLDAAALAGVLGEVGRINDEGGLLGREVQVRRFDTNSRTSITERLARRIVADEPDLLIVSCDVEFARPALELADEAGLVTISPCADDDGYVAGDLGSRNFALGAPEFARGEIVGSAAARLYGTTAMVLRDTTSPEALEFCEGFESAFEASGGVILYDDSFNYDTLGPLQDRVKESAPQTAVIAVCSHVPGGVDGAPSVISTLRTLGFQAPIAAGSSVDQVGWFSSVPQLNDLLFVSWSSVYGNDPDDDDVNDIVARAGAIDLAFDGPVAAADAALADAIEQREEAQLAFDDAPADDNENEAEELASAKRELAIAENDLLLAEQAARVRIGGSTLLGAESIILWERAVERAQSLEPSRVAAALGSFVDERVPSGSISFLGGRRLDQIREYRLMRVQAGRLTVLDIVESG